MNVLKKEYHGNDQQKEQIEQSIKILIKKDDFEIVTVRFQSILDGVFKAQLFIVEKGAIKDRVERLNYKYHAGTFEQSYNLNSIKNEIRYKVVLPSGSVPHVVTLHEYFRIDNHKIRSLLEYFSEERDCTMGQGQGELIKRKLISENGSYFINTHVYEFDCNDFEFEKEIENQTLITEKREKLDVF